jgi:hypothetical protein
MNNIYKKFNKSKNHFQITPKIQFILLIIPNNNNNKFNFLTLLYKSLKNMTDNIKIIFQMNNSLINNLRQINNIIKIVIN